MPTTPPGGLAVDVVARSTWGARSWATTPYQVAMTERRYFVVHYDGGNPITRTGYTIPRTIDDEHHANGWSGIGYNFVVSEAGEIFEGRGWDLVGAHCPSRNRDGIGVQIAIGGDQAPTAAALTAARWLYDEASRRAGRTLGKTWHGANYPTACPGPRLIGWVKLGMTAQQPTQPAPGAPTGEADDVSADEVWKRPYTSTPAERAAGYGPTIFAEDRLYEAANAAAEARAAIAEMNTLLANLSGQVAALGQGAVPAASAPADQPAAGLSRADLQADVRKAVADVLHSATP